MSTTIEALQAWNSHPPELPIKIPCPFPPSGAEWSATPKCHAVVLFNPTRTKTGLSLRKRARSAVQSHLHRHYQLRERERSLLLDDAVEGL